MPIKEKFSNWIDEYHRALYRHALWMTGDTELAADVVQETYHLAWLSIKTLKDEARVFPWLLTILRRTTFREYKREIQHEKLVADLCSLHQSNGSSSLEYELLDLSRALGMLSTSYRETLLLYALDGFSYQEIAEQMNIPIGTVMSRISRARELIKSSDESVPSKIINFRSNSK